VVYHKRPDKLDNPGPLLGVMRTCRQAMTETSAQVKPMGTVYHGLSMVVWAIDALAGLLTGGRNDYFWSTGSGATQGEIARGAADREVERHRPGTDELKTLIADGERSPEGAP
jgi:hypothetical protein